MSEEKHHPVVELLIARMESNPEEFLGNNIRWTDLMNTYRDFFSDEEEKAIDGAYHKVKMNELHQTVMKLLLSGVSEEQEWAEEIGRKQQALYQGYASAATHQQAIQNAQQFGQHISSVTGSYTTLPTYEAIFGTPSPPAKKKSKWFP